MADSNNYVINPKTGRKILKTGKVYKQLIKDGYKFDEINETNETNKTNKTNETNGNIEHIINPLTQRKIIYGGKTFQYVLKMGYIFNSSTNTFIKCYTNKYNIEYLLNIGYADDIGYAEDIQQYEIIDLIKIK